MMKWKVVKNPRSSSADRSLECLKNDVQQQPNNISNNNSASTNSNSDNNNNNCNAGEDNKQDNNSPAVKETNRQRESSLVRKPSIVATECINLKSILGLTRQRSETNLSNLGLVNNEPRRSRSEVRGVSCDRLTVGYHTAPGNNFENGKTRSSSPPCRPGWLRGRKRERESRNPVKNNQDVFGKTVVTGSNGKRTSSRTRNGDCRTIVDGSDGKHKNKLCSTRNSLEPRKCKTIKKGSEEDIIEEELYCEINNDNNARGKLLEEDKEVFKAPTKVIRKKGMAPKPQITTNLFKDTNGDVNLNSNGEKLCESPNSVNEAILENRKTQKKNQTFNGRNQDKKSENRGIHSVKINNLKNSERAVINTMNVQSIVAVAEVHKEVTYLSSNNKNKNMDIDKEIVKNNDINNANKISQNKVSLQEMKQAELAEKDESLPFYIDTPDYSTLDSVNCNTRDLSMEDINLLKDDIINCNTDSDENQLNLQDMSPVIISENSKNTPENSLSSILRDSTNENKDSEPKKTVRFEKLDLIEKYKKSKGENSMDVEEDSDASGTESKSDNKKPVDYNSNNIIEPSNTEGDGSPQCSENLADENNCTNSMTVNVLVRNPSPAPQEIQNEESPTQFVVKKSFVLTIAKQEKGFKSLCATKKPEVVPEPPKSDQQQISVTFLCSGPPSEGWVLPTPEDHQRLRSISVPPRSLQPVEMVTALPAMRGRSRERRSKDRQHCKKNHKARKKDAVFVMPQAVIDELSQVLEKRKPSLDEIPVHP